MSQQDDRNLEDDAPERPASTNNPFAIGDEAEQEKPQINLSPKRAAMFGLSFGLVMVGLLLICFLGAALLASCTDV